MVVYNLKGGNNMNKRQTMAARFNKEPHRYIVSVEPISNTYGTGWGIYGKAGFLQFYGYSLKEAVIRYNKKVKANRFK